MPAPIELQDAKDAPEGATLFRYVVELSRTVERKEKGRVVITTATPPGLLKDRWDQIWDIVDEAELLDEQDWLSREDNHKEVVVSESTITKRCPFTAEMKF